MGTVRGPNLVTDGLVLCLDAANTLSYPGSGSTWTDLSGNGNHATVGSSVTYSSTNGGGLTTLNETNTPNTAISGTFSLSSANYTWEIWFKDNGSQGGDNSAFGVRDSIGISSNGFRAQPYIHTAVDGSWVNLTTTALATSSPTQVIQRRNGTTFHGFVNGVISDTDTGGSGFGTFASYSMNDKSHTSSGNGWNGTYYLVKMYNRALTDAEVLQNFEANKGRFGL